ncbi:hypothetical protein SPRG_00187 [Saprolegnia parasitica CBS 223.65]|uniref:HIT-type domain-containing protein n=1 Tax=Saprolegnia parasitica (strain CBS 223.65) TaxID=695850 RepID=A0A067CXW7_SAPPC|nr:hypothetical protein SPRG_00187 [Saprolegnia parasitica CBS 223.65]KDO35338.1 hypothetical protein SPRG_00187 [Saprolegnia parasitica CBS 223.65]|eukprot:XP_012193684.1 hypothetical protein SPRG_00187 [Saprolegnia parasitica CBS 223.65]
MSLVCGVCNEKPSKYKCPVCRLRYCSAPCYKLHKDAACGQPAAPAKQAPATSSPEATPVPAPSASEPMPMPSVSEMTAPIPTDILEPTRNADSVIAAVPAIVEDVEAAVETVLAAEPSDVDAMAMDAAERLAAHTNVTDAVDEALVVPALIADDDDEANIHLLTKAQLQAIASSTLVHKALENPHFRSRIQEIDSHADRLLELQKALTDPSFAQFVYGMMDEVREAGP